MTVIVGRKSYKKHEIENKSYVSNIRGNKHTGLQFYSQNHDSIGKIDEAIETDRESILIVRKYSDNVIIRETMLLQIGLLGILLSEYLRKPVKSYIVLFEKNKREVKKVQTDDHVTPLALEKLKEVKKCLQNL